MFASFAKAIEAVTIVAEISVSFPPASSTTRKFNSAVSNQLKAILSVEIKVPSDLARL